MRRFEVTFYTDFEEEVDTAIIDLDEICINVVDDDWRDHLYNLHTPEEIAAHIAYNLFVNGIKLTQMDGWADQKDSMVKIVKYPHLDNFDVVAIEIPILQFRSRKTST